MTTTLSGATALALAMALTTGLTAQTRDEQPGQQEQQPGQQQQQERLQQQDRPGQAQQADQQQRQRQTIRGRITSVELADRPGREGQESQSERPGQAGLQGPAAGENRAIIMVEARDMMRDRPGSQRDAGASPGDQPGTPRLDDQPDTPQAGREPGLQDRPGLGDAQGGQSQVGREPGLQDRPGDARARLGQQGSQRMTMYQFVVTDETLIQANIEGDQPGQTGATDRPSPGQQDRPGQPTPGSQQEPGARPGQQPGQSIEAGQLASQEYRGLRAGQYVEVTYRPLLETQGQQGQQDRPDQPGQQDRPGQQDQQDDQPGQSDQPRSNPGQQDQPRPDQAGQDPTSRRPGQLGQAEHGQMIRGEAVSIRVIPGPDREQNLDRPSTPGLDRPESGVVNPDRPEPNQGSDRPNPDPIP